MTDASTVADELAIRNAINHIAQLADLAGVDELDDYMAYIAPDAVWDMNGAVSDGAAAIRAGAVARRESGTAGPGVPTRHCIVNTVVWVEGDTARAKSYFLLVGLVGTGEAVVKMSGRYNDSFKRYPDGWKYTKREIRFH